MKFSPSILGVKSPYFWGITQKPMKKYRFGPPKTRLFTIQKPLKMIKKTLLSGPAPQRVGSISIFGHRHAPVFVRHQPAGLLTIFGDSFGAFLRGVYVSITSQHTIFLDQTKKIFRSLENTQFNFYDHQESWITVNILFFIKIHVSYCGFLNGSRLLDLGENEDTGVLVRGPNGWQETNTNRWNLKKTVRYFEVSLLKFTSFSEKLEWLIGC